MRRPPTQAKPAPPKAVTPVLAQSRWPAWLMGVSLVLVTMALYWPATRGDFVNYDDNAYVTANSHVQNGLTWESIKWACLNPVCCNWHPLTVWSHALVCQVCGLNPWGHHLTNVLLHALNAGLVFALLRQMTGATWRSLLVAALFAVHPLRVESVAWVSERKDVLSGFFGLLALLAYARYTEVQSSKSKVPSPWSVVRGPRSLSHLPPPIFYLLSLSLFALGLMSKPMLVTLPFVMLLLDYWPLRRSAECGMRRAGPGAGVRGQGGALPWMKLIWEKAPFFALAALASIVTLVVQQRGGSVVAGENLFLGARGENALISYCRHLGKLFWPTDLAVFYPHPGQWPLGKALLAGGVMLGISGMLWMRRRRAPYLLVGWLWFCGMLVPVIGLVQTGAQAMADRHTYLPSLGVLILAIWGVYELSRGWRHGLLAFSAAGGVATVLCLVLTRQQIGYWQDSETLFRHALAVTENNDLAHLNLGVALGGKGQTDEAIRQYREAIRLKPDYADAHNNLGTALDHKGQIDEAIRQFKEAIRLEPDYADAHNNLGTALLIKGQIDEATRQYQEAMRLKPDYADAHNNLGTALDKKGQLGEAFSQYQEAIRLKPDYADAHNNLGAALDKRGQIDEAIRQFQAAARLKPDDVDFHINLGNALAERGQWDDAIGQYQQAIRLKPDDADAHYNLGNTLGKKGQIDEAIRQYQAALRLKPDYADAHYNLGITLVTKGQLDEAIRQYQETVRLRPDHAEACNNLGAAFYQQGRTGEAIRQFEEALRLKPDFAGARRNLDIVLAARAQAPPPPGGSTNP